MEEKKGVWRLEYLEPIQQNPDEQNDADETEESK
jgi:hypothetical protein